VFCSHCGVRLDPGARFCQRCGHQVAPTAYAQPMGDTRAPSPQGPPTPYADPAAYQAQATWAGAPSIPQAPSAPSIPQAHLSQAHLSQPPGDPYATLMSPLPRPEADAWRKPASVIAAQRWAIVFFGVAIVNAVIIVTQGVPLLAVAGLAGGVVVWLLARALSNRSEGARIALIVLAVLSLLSFLFTLLQTFTIIGGYWGFLSVGAQALYLFSLLMSGVAMLAQTLVLINALAADSRSWTKDRRMTNQSS